MQRASARDRLEQALARISDPAGEGARAVLTVYPESARREADAADARAKSGKPLGPLDGAIVSIKDLFDVAGEVTRAGSRVLAEEEKPATADAEAVRRLRAGGAVIAGKTNMSEFAFSGVGTNPHYGTPGIPADRKRVPGGSSSGAAVAAADGMCEISIGSDTGGSTRIPAALTGIVGFKPSKQRVPTDGAFPLSGTLDSIGPIAKTVAQCALADAVMAGEAASPLEAVSPNGLRLAIVRGVPFEGIEAPVAETFDAACAALTRAGAKLSDGKFPQVDAIAGVNAKGGIAPYEAYVIHKDRLARRAKDIDPKIAARIERAGKIPAADYAAMLSERAMLIAAMDSAMTPFDALIMPTVPILAPTIAEVEADDVFARKNALLLRNTSISNFLNLCAISLPLAAASGLPCGFSLIARNGQDRRLLAMAAAVEALLSGGRR